MLSSEWAVEVVTLETWSVSMFSHLPQESLPRPVRKPREMAQVSAGLNRSLTAYALVAGAAGVSAVAMGQSADDNTIVYTPANIPFYGSRRANFKIPLDLNQDGITDITIWAGGSGFSLGTASISYYDGTAGWYAPAGAGGIKRPLTKGMEIGSVKGFSPNGILIRSVLSHSGRREKHGCVGNFKDRTAYLGIRFPISGETHYGWVLLSTACAYGSGDVSGTVEGYAYNTVANQPIGAGQMQSKNASKQEAAIPGALEMLSLGAAGLPSRRQ
jgi:hypothetical protein